MVGLLASIPEMGQVRVLTGDGTLLAIVAGINVDNHLN